MQETYILLSPKLPAFTLPIFFDIQMHNGTLTIAYYMCYFNKQIPQIKVNTTTHQSQLPLKFFYHTYGVLPQDFTRFPVEDIFRKKYFSISRDGKTKKGANSQENNTHIHFRI